jgi:hypothetical protein
VLDERESYLSIIEGIQDISAENAGAIRASAARPAGSRRRRLSPDEQRDIARLYNKHQHADIGDPRALWYRENLPCSVWCNDVAWGVNGPIPQPSQTSPGTRAAGPQRQRSCEAIGAELAIWRSRSNRGVAAAEGTRSLDGSGSSRTGGGARQPFRIQLQGEVVVEAADIPDAPSSSRVPPTNRDYGGRPPD